MKALTLILFEQVSRQLSQSLPELPAAKKRKGDDVDSPDNDPFS
jgi:hypothetical protein